MSQQNPYQPPQVADLGVPPYGGGSVVQGEVPAVIVEVMRQTRPWVVFLAIMGFIGTAFMVLGGLAMVGFSSVAKLSPACGLVSIVLAVLSLLPSLSLLRYGTGIRRFLEGGGMVGLAQALASQKSFWRLIGILTLVMIGLYVLAMVGGAAAFMLGAVPNK